MGILYSFFFVFPFFFITPLLEYYSSMIRLILTSIQQDLKPTILRISAKKYSSM